MKIIGSLLLLASLASAAQIPVGNVANDQFFATRSGNQFQNVSLPAYDGKIVIIMLMTPWCPFCQSNASAVGSGLLAHFNASSRGSLMGKNANGVPIESVLLSTEEAAQWDSVNASFASTNGFGQWGLDANASRSDPRKLLGYFRGGFINSANLYSWGDDRRRVVVLNMVKDSTTHDYREIVINQNAYSASDDTAARAAINAIQPKTTSSPATITSQPVSTTLNIGQSAVLTVVASGGAPLTYAWFRGASGTTTEPVGTNSAAFTTPSLTATTSYWVRVTNADNLTGADSAAATVTVLQPAAITTSPASTTVNYGQPTTLSVVASGDDALSYQWYEGAGGVTSKPVGTNAPSFTTSSITTTKSYWVRVSNAVNPAGADSAAATVSVLLVTSAYARALNQSAGIFVISARGAEGSTYLGWDTFNDALDRSAQINDSTPDIGTTVVGANFQTTNAEDHVIENGDLSFTSGSLAEQIIVPTDGTVGADGFTTIVLQLAAIPGSGAFPGAITLNSLNGVSPIIVQALNSAGDGQLWAKWQLPGNQASYTIAITGAENQANFGFDKVVADSHFSVTEYLPDSVAATLPSITTATVLNPRLIGVALNQQLAASGGTAPYEFVVTAGNLPVGVSLSSTGLLSGTPTAAAASNFTVKLSDANVLMASKVFSLSVISDLSVLTTSLLTPVRNVAFSQRLVGSGGTAPYTWTLSAGSLPAGLSLSSAGVVSGIPSLTASSSTFTVRLTDGTGFAVMRQFTLPVSTVFLPPVLQPISFPPLTIGADFSYTVTALNYPSAFAVTCLPLGLKFSTTTGVITGRSQVAGLYNVQVRASNKGGSSAAITTRLVVRALDKNLVGTFGGLVSRHSSLNRSLGGSLTVTTTFIGSYTVRLVGAYANSTASGAATAYTAAGFLAATAPQISLPIGGQMLSLTLNPTTGQMDGTLGAASVNGWRAAWNATTNPAESLFGYYSMAMDLADAPDKGLAAIPQGTGFATFIVSLAGVLTTVGRTADGEAITSASFLGTGGDYWVYAPMYKNGGSIQGPLKLTEDTAGHFADNEIDGRMTWFKPTTTGRTYAASFGPLNLNAEGGYLAPASKGSIVLGLPAPGSVSLSFTDGGLASSITDPDLNFTLTEDNKILLPQAIANPGKVALTINPATGVIAGSFSLAETSPLLVRSKIAFQGQVVRQRSSNPKAVGYFLLPQIPTPGQAATAAQILSGGFTLE